MFQGPLGILISSKYTWCQIAVLKRAPLAYVAFIIPLAGPKWSPSRRFGAKRIEVKDGELTLMYRPRTLFLYLVVRYF